MTIAEQKRQLRLLSISLVEKIGANLRAQFSEKIQEQIFQLQAFRNADLVLGFVPTDSEPHINGVYDRAINLEKTIAFPRCEKAGFMEFHEMGFDWRDRIVRGRLPVYEPDSSVQAPVDYNRYKQVLILVPALAYTMHRRRLGRGKGYYDRFLAQRFSNAQVVGVCFEVQMVAEIPFEPHDMVVDLVVTESNNY